jgi:uncharacterized YigZ family protein
MENYYTIEKASLAEFKDRGSRFLAHAYPIKDTSEFKQYLQELKKEHPKAVHHCFAYRIGHDFNTFRANDDGEPSGSAGKPILGQIDSKQLTNVAVIVVRYFGGSLLGVPGLINAYKSATSLALQTTPIVQKPIMSHFQIDFDYQQLNQVMSMIKSMQGEVTAQDINLFSTVSFGVPRHRTDELHLRLSDLRNCTVKKL